MAVAARSFDEGRTWLPAVQILSQPLELSFDPETGDELPEPLGRAAVAPDGAVYVVVGSSAGAIDVARSPDGGTTWGVSSLPGVSAFAFEPAVVVDSHGTVGITWYDLRNDRLGDAALTTDVWFANSDDDGVSWQQTHVAGPFDLRAAPFRRLGEYQGFASMRSRGFAAIFTMAAPEAKDGPSDIFFAQIGPGRSGP